MVNTKQKGQRKELMVEEEMHAEGRTVVFRSFTIKRGPIYIGVDFADLFDVVAVRGRNYSFISSKHGTHGENSQHFRDIQAYAEISGWEYASFEIWCWQASRWTGRGKNKRWVTAHWDKVKVWTGSRFN